MATIEETITELARAYNNLGGPDDPAPCRKAVELLESVRDSLGDDALWNYRMAYSYWMMDREPDAVPYLQRAVELDPEDGYFAELLEQCVDSLDLPSFRRCFRERCLTSTSNLPMDVRTVLLATISAVLPLSAREEAHLSL